MTKSIILFLSTFLFTTSVSFAQESWYDNPVKRVAQITMDLNHNPSDTEKAELSEIMSNEGVNKDLRAIASALYNFDHKVSDKNRSELEIISHNTDSLPAMKTLANALLDCDHTVRDADKTAIAKIITP